MNERILNAFSAQDGSFIIIIDDENRAFVLPVVGWVAVVRTWDDGKETLDIDPLISDGRPSTGVWGGPEPIYDSAYKLFDWKTFAPGENALPFIERREEDTGEKIAMYDVSVWMPSQSPLFATADDTLWSNDFIPPDMDEE